MPVDRHDHSCGLIRVGNGQWEIVVAGRNMFLWASCWNCASFCYAILQEEREVREKWVLAVALFTAEWTFTWSIQTPGERVKNLTLIGYSTSVRWSGSLSLSITGNRLPQPQTQSAVVPLDNTFLLTGGFDSDINELAYVYQYDAQSGDWIKLETELKTPRKQHVALLVNRSLFPECK